MRAAALTAATLLITACGQSPMGSPTTDGPPADAPPIAASPDYSGDFDALGTEPFWNMKIRSGGVTLSRPDHSELFSTEKALEVLGEEAVFQAELNGHSVSLRLAPGDCSEGMSDRRYDYVAELRIDDQVLKGCAARPGDLAAQPKP